MPRQSGQAEPELSRLEGRRPAPPFSPDGRSSTFGRSVAGAAVGSTARGSSSPPWNCCRRAAQRECDQPATGVDRSHAHNTKTNALNSTTASGSTASVGERAARKVGGPPARSLSGPRGPLLPYRGRDTRLAQAAVGIDARVDQIDDLADALRRARASDGVNAAAVNVADGVPPPVATLADRA
jgi:hypothetical protein